MIRQRTAGLMLLLVLGSGLLSAQTPPAGDRPSPLTRRILILHDQNLSSPTMSLFDDEIQESLRGSKYRIELYREYFDVQTFPGEADQKLIRDFLIRRYRDRRPDVIITIGAPALQFMAEEHHHDFAGIPVVYCLPSGAERDLKSDPEFTGVAMALDAAATLRAALQMLPHTRHLFVITGTGAYDLFQVQGVKKQLEDFSSRVDITYLAGLAMADLRKRLSSLPKNSIVLFTTHSRDGAGAFFNFQENGSLISSASNAPVFTLIDVQIGYGQVGGDLAKSMAEGTIAGSAALKILDGVSPSRIPVAEVPNGFVFDWRALKRWGMNESDLPPGSTVLNRTPSAWELYRWYIIGVISLVSLETLLISALLWHRARRRRTEQALTASEELLRQFIRYTPAAVAMFDNEMRYLQASERWLTDYHLEGQAVIGRSHYEVFPDIPARWKEVHRRVLAGAVERCDEDPFPRADGGMEWLQWEVRPWHKPGGEIGGLTMFTQVITERKREQNALRDSEGRLAALIETALDAIIAVDEEQRIVLFNTSAERIFGCPAATAMGSSLDRFIPQRFRTAHSAHIRRFGETGTSSRVMGALDTLSGLRSNGEEFPIEAAISQIETSGKRLYTVMIRDISARKKAEAESRRANRALQTLSNCNKALVRAASESDLLEEVCEIVVREGGYRMAWVGIGEHDETKSVSPVAHAGFENGYLLTAKISWADTERGRGPTGTAIRTGETVIARNIQADPNFPAWREEALKRGYASSIALPILLNGRVFGALTIYAEEPDEFDSAEVELLTELSDDLAFGIRALRTKAERERAEEVVRESEAQLKEAQRIAHVGSSVWDLATNTTVWSDELYRIAGRDPRQPPPRHSERASLYAPESWARLEGAVQRALATGEPYDLELEVVRPDGTRRQTYARGMPLRGADGHIVTLQGTLQDITEIKQAEEALRQNEAALKEALLAAQMGVWNLTIETGTIAWDENLYRLAGRDCGLPVPKYQELSQIYTPASWERLKSAVEDALTTGTPYELDLEMLRPDGTKRCWISRGASARDASGRIIRLRGTVQDITERKQSEERVKASEERFRKAFMTGADGFYISTLNEGRLIEANDCFKNIFGYSHEEMAGKTSLELGLFANPEDRQRLVSELKAKGLVRNMELKGRRKDGNLIDMLFSINLLRGGDEQLMLSVVRDITAQKSLEEQFRQAQKMEAVGRLAGGVAHDFNNLLTIINGYTQMLLEASGTDDSRSAHLQEILQAGERAASLTQQLLAFSRKQVIEPRVLDLNGLLKNTEKMLRRLIGEDMQLRTVLEPQLGQVKADPAQVEQVIMNLAINARDAMPRGGKLIIETSNAELDESYARSHAEVTPGNYVMLAVSDTGCGMNAATLSHIFEPFFTTKEAGKGTGLGLATVHGIVKQAGGHISVYSEVGHGTTFKIYVPRLDRPVEKTAEKQVTPVPLSGSETILLVEDEPAVRSLIRAALEPRGYTVLVAAHPEEAVTLAEHHAGTIHLLLTDVIMPGFSGKELADHLLFSRPELKVLFISGYTSDAIVHHGILDEGVAFLPKPFTSHGLLRRVRAVLDQQEPAQETSAL